ncbi:acetate kinase [Treponema primitia ZAS-2]|uniref:Acetate kinase n=1 Tax=Treponema primitia (strain ATCC BAA-887 / DSM 12427 / ZAS-2) TaxID=545694 RepID=F5YGV2_TREPZ|nr:acetate kinase [Treponema primitia]AEF84361.1 acetate kinase [Treponema primitia ZAS-2]
MVILVLNCGSSSAKYQVYDWDAKDILAVGVVEKVTLGGSFISHKVKGREEITIQHDCPTHTDAVDFIIKTLTSKENGVISDMSVIKAVGHRVLHGGDKFTKSVIVDDAAMAAFNEVKDLGPLHNPANIMGIEAAKKVLPNVPHCAIMDTAWHQTMPPESFLYATPYEWYEKYGVRRYGFHGTSFLYTAKRAAVLLGQDPYKTNLIICHLGNGASVNAVKDGKSFDTSMGITPLEGLIMGTRSGDADPAMPFYVMRKTGMSPAEMENALNKKSGLLGITGQYADRRDIQKAALAGDARAKLAQDMEAQRVKKYIGGYLATLGRVDALVFTAGVGEFAFFIRKKILEGLEGLGIVYDSKKNDLACTRNTETLISKPESKIPIYIIPTDEELVMTEDAYALMAGTYDVHTKFTYSFQSKDYVNKGRAEGLKEELKKKPDLQSVIAVPK